MISKVPNTLHTPLMSGTNAIHGIVVLGGLLLMHEASGVFEQVLLVIAVAFGTINVIGGFLVTDRMLGMFKKKPRARADGDGGQAQVSILATSFVQSNGLHRRLLHRRVLAVHLRDERADGPAHGGPRQQDRGGSGWRSRSVATLLTPGVLHRHRHVPG